MHAAAGLPPTGRRAIRLAAGRPADRACPRRLAITRRRPPGRTGALAIYRGAPRHPTTPDRSDHCDGGAQRARGIGGGGPTRQTAMALLDDPTQAQSTRRGALALLVDSQQPDALAAIERASGDADPELRSDALEALNNQDP